MADRYPLDSSNSSQLGTIADNDRLSIGPSDSSDSGSDLAGLDRVDDDTDREGTGERPSSENQVNMGDHERDIGFDRVVGADEAGLGGGLDQAEEAIAGITDEEIAELARRGR